MNNNIKIALVGCGALAKTFYLPVLKRLGINLFALVDPSMEKTKELAKQWSIKKVIASPEEIVDVVDAAIIASPNFLHTSQAKLFLEKGKHVLLEKPIASTENEVMELIETAGRSGAVLQPGMMRRFWKINKAVKKLLQEELLGKLKIITMQEGAVLNWPVESTAIFDSALSLGGVFMDTGSHTLDLLSWWVGDKNFELEYEDDNYGGVDADCRLAVNFIDKAVKAEVKLSRIRNMPNEFILTGAKGWIKLKPYANIFESSNRTIDKYIYNLYSAADLKQQSFEDLFAEQVKSWQQAIEQDSEPVVSAESVLPSIRMIEQGYKNRRQLNYAWN